MVRRVYADNYRSLVNFEWSPGCEALVLGCNGSGKSTAIDVISLIRLGVLGYLPLAHMYAYKELTAWSKKDILRLEIDL